MDPELTADVAAQSEDTLNVTPFWRRTRPPWLIFALSICTFGLYAFYWLYATWRELKLELQDPGMRPMWHMWAIAFVPIYNLFRFHAHMRTIRELVLPAGVSTSLSPGWAVVIWLVTTMVSNGTARLALRGFETPFWLDFVVTLVDAAVLVWAQSALNDTWRVLPGGVQRFSVHPVEWVVMGVGGLLLLLSLVGSML